MPIKCTGVSRPVLFCLFHLVTYVIFAFDLHEIDTEARNRSGSLHPFNLVAVALASTTISQWKWQNIEKTVWLHGYASPSSGSRPQEVFCQEWLAS